MNLNTLSKSDLLLKCKENGIIKCKSKTKSQLIKLIQQKTQINKPVEPISQSQPVNDNIIFTDTTSEIPTNTSQLTLVDLFAGTGAFSYAFQLTKRVKTVFANDMIDSSETIFNLNHIHNETRLTKRNLIEINDIDIPKSNILTAGFPCQPFSIAGNQKGFEDERSNVFWKIISILKTHSPEIVILENVKNLQSHDNGNTFKTIIENLQKLKYHVKYSILNTCKITGIPQNRERIYIVCFKDASLYEKFDFDFPEIENRPIIDFLETTSEISIDKKYYYSNSTVIYNELIANIKKPVSTNTVYQYRRYYVRENKNGVCPTLTANMGSGGHNVPLIMEDTTGKIRKLTPRECFNLQGFPNNYQIPQNLSMSKLYSLAGNAVSLPVVSLIANRLIELLYEKNEVI
jgi:DNA (cytosine-5)-methyltransferase 1